MSKRVEVFVLSLILMNLQSVLGIALLIHFFGRGVIQAVFACCLSVGVLLVIVDVLCEAMDARDADERERVQEGVFDKGLWEKVSREQEEGVFDEDVWERVSRDVLANHLAPFAE